MFDLAGFYIGTSHGELGDSGSGIFESSGHFFGFSIGKKNFAFIDPQNMPIGEVADHQNVETRIIDSDIILGIGQIVGPDVS